MSYYITKPNQKVMKLCPVCSKNMIENHFKDLVCHCTGKCLDLASLENLYRSKSFPVANKIASQHKFRELHEPVLIHVAEGFSTVRRAEQLKAKGFVWNSSLKCFTKHYSAKQDSQNDVEFLTDFGYKHSIHKQ